VSGVREPGGHGVIRDVWGHRVLWWRPRQCPYRVRQWLPQKREERYRVMKNGIWFVLHWRPYHGLWAGSGGHGDRHDAAPVWVYPRVQESTVKRRSAPTGGVVITPPIPSTSVQMPKVPMIREWLHSTAYEDGSPRQPGYMTIRNKVTVMEVTMYDPDAGARLPVRAATLDQALVLLEQLLGVEEAPWEPDRYLMEQLVARGKRKK
jgi:hypothetical protein